MLHQPVTVMLGRSRCWQSLGRYRFAAAALIVPVANKSQMMSSAARWLHHWGCCNRFCICCPCNRRAEGCYLPACLAGVLFALNGAGRLGTRPHSGTPELSESWQSSWTCWAEHCCPCGYTQTFQLWHECVRLALNEAGRLRARSDSSIPALSGSWSSSWL